MTALIDTNVLLDVLAHRQNFYPCSKVIFDLCETRKIKGYISSLSIADLVYVMRKELKKEDINYVLLTLELIFQVTDLNVDDINKASETNTSDFEDGIQIATAKRIKADCIITRNKNDFENNSLPLFTPEEAVKRFI
jgi:predicted nucleic-acid-binding protein